MRLLLLNGNANRAMTEQMARRAGELLEGRAEVLTETAHRSVAYVESRRDAALSGAAVVELAERHLASGERPADSVVLACFGEPGMAAVRELSPVPVVGMLEASVISALQLGSRFSIITPGRRWPRMIDDMLHELGATRRCLAVEAVEVADLRLPEQRGEARSRVQAVVERQHRSLEPDVIIIGGAAFVGMVRELPDYPGCRLVDSLDAALLQARALMTLG
ncbi:MAG: hydrogenase expression protein HupH [Halomonas sp.]|uniref:aspartate/glutamate racemase family protein n=1 Tax=Halomonas sp. TaxID=1486246 RepID=UPI0019F18DD7|nr:aspartate/glutamate racemase family protein [Halomonas sp.]MBE0490108.1 hydrogenase expression protein HupH [Halomonas sp.]